MNRILLHLLVLICFGLQASAQSDIGSLRDSLLNESISLFERQLDEIELALESLDSEEHWDENLKALESFQAESRIHVARLAIEIRRKMNNNPDYLQSKESKADLTVMRRVLMRQNTRLEMQVTRIRADIINQDLDDQARIFLYGRLASIDLRRTRNWSEAVTFLEPLFLNKASLSETQLRLTLEACHQFFELALDQLKEAEAEVLKLSNLLREFEGEALEPKLIQWLQRPSRQLLQDFDPDDAANDHEAFLIQFKTALREKKNLQEILDLRLEELRNSRERMKDTIDIVSEITAELAKKNPKAVYKILVGELDLGVETDE